MLTVVITQRRCHASRVISSPARIAQKNTVMTNVSMTVASPAFPDGFNTYL